MNVHKSITFHESKITETQPQQLEIGWNAKSRPDSFKGRTHYRLLANMAVKKIYR